MKNNKKGVSLLVLTITIVVIVILATAIITNIGNENLVLRAEWVASEARIKELEYAITEISSDYELLSEKDATVRSMSLKDYILQRLREEYKLTSVEENSITIDENGKLSVIE